MSVLVVESEPITRVNLLDYLLLAGFDVVAAPNGPIGLAFVEDPTLRFRAAIVDLHLHGATDGVDVADLVQEKRPGTLIIVTSRDFERPDLRWMRRGWVLLPKPFRLRRVVEILNGTGIAAVPAKVAHAPDRPTSGARRHVLH